MLNIHTIPVGMLQTNCYLVCREGAAECLVIDPGDSARKIRQKLESEGLTIAAILLTHGHFDHDGAVKDLALDSDCPVYMNKKELILPAHFPTGRRGYTHTCAEGDVLQLAGLTVRVLETPGHTPGSVCYLVEDALFSGDTLFAGGCGRTDFPCGNGAHMMESLRRLASLEGDFAVYPGHGEATTLAAERQYNPYMR